MKQQKVIKKGQYKEKHLTQSHIFPCKIKEQLNKINERLNAKNKGNYKLADQIRDELLKKDVVIEDQKNKTIWKFK